MPDQVPAGERSPDLSSRRTFLAQAAALAGAGSLLAGCGSLARRGPLPHAKSPAPPRPGESVRLGVIGLGGMGAGHLDALLAFPAAGREQLEVVALGEVCAARLAAARQKCDAVQKTPVATYGDHRELLARGDLHGVVIATPEHWHAEMTEDAIAAGIDVYVEKPMTLRLAEALRLREVVRANPDVIVQVGTQFTTHRKYHEAKRLIQSGEIGKPVFSQTSYCRNSKDGEWLYYEIDPAWEPGVNLDWERWCGPLGEQRWDPAVYARWRRYRTFSTGILGDLLVHVMTPMIWTLEQGWPTRVVASGGHYVDTAMENHDQVNVVVQFEHGHTLTAAGSTCNEQGDPAMIRGHRATLYLGGKDCLLRPERHWTDEIVEETITCPPTEGDQDELRLDWLRCIRTREPNLSNVELGAQVMVIVDLATRSMWEGQAFAFDPESLTAYAV